MSIKTINRNKYDYRTIIHRSVRRLIASPKTNASTNLNKLPHLFFGATERFNNGIHLLVVYTVCISFMPSVLLRHDGQLTKRTLSNNINTPFDILFFDVCKTLINSNPNNNHVHFFWGNPPNSCSVTYPLVKWVCNGTCTIK